MADNSKDKLTPLVAWSFSVGTAIGWGTFVVTTNTYLKGAGPAGSIISLVIGAAVMLLISRNYHFMMNRFSTSGGMFIYASEALGADFGFTSSWFLMLAYIAMFWANVTAFPLFTEYLFGDLLRFGFHYTVFEYDVYLSEAFISIALIILTAVLCINSKRLAYKINTFFVLFFIIAITICFAAAMLKHSPSFSFAPAFASEKIEISRIFRVVLVSPWAFVGFENISNAISDFSFSRKKSYKILSSAVFTVTALYIFVILLSSSAYPPQFHSYLEYINNLDKFTGIDSLPPLYAAKHYIGSVGAVLLFGALLAFLLTSFIGNLLAMSRLIATSAKAGALPQILSRTNGNGIPVNAIKLVALISVFIPFLGRTALGWILDVTSINATVVYGFISLATWRIAKKESCVREKMTGFFGLVLMIVFAAAIILPNLFYDSAIATETYLLFIVWAILGFVAFHYVVKMDKNDRFGNESAGVWIVLSTMILLISLIWLNEINRNSISNALSDIQDFKTGRHALSLAMSEDAFIARTLKDIHHTNMQCSVFVVLLFSLSIFMMVSNSLIIQKNKIRSEKNISAAKEIANRDALTGVRSKHAFVEFEKSINERLKAGERIDFAVVVCDVNGLKQINDNLGHKAGDEFIKNACSLICNTFKHSPVFRIGGDEFVAIMMGQDFENRNGIMAAFNALVEKNRDEGKVVIAAGISDFAAQSDTAFLTVFERADELMYKRKKQLKGIA